jgi:hypothetical protein
MDVLQVVGILLVVLAAADAIVTVMYPSRTGYLTVATSGVMWHAARGVASALGRPRFLTVAGPLTVLALFATWTLLPTLGYALIYLPSLDQLSFSTPAGDRNLWDALYVSGVCLTTLGFGDVVPTTNGLRFVNVTEAAFGFGIMTAAIAYLLSLYPLISTIRTAARTAHSQADDPVRAAEVVVEGEASYLQSLLQQMIGVDENLQRYPLLLHFHTEDRTGSLQTLMRGGIMVCLQARWGVSEDAASYARLHGDELKHRIDRIIENFARRVPLLDTRDGERGLDPADARRRFERLIQAAGERARDEPPSDEEVRQFATFVGRCEAFLDTLSNYELDPPARLLADQPRTAAAAQPAASAR